MKLTTKSEYSILALIYLARNQERDLIKIDEICKACNIPKKYLIALLSILKQNNLIKAKRGATGGYKLAKDASQINLADIIRLMDGALTPTESVSKHFHSDTPLQKEEKIITVLQDIRNYISNKLESLTLRDLV